MTSLFIVSVSFLAFFFWLDYREHQRLKRRCDAFLRFCYEYKNKKLAPLRKGFDEPNELDVLEADFMRWLLKNNYVENGKGLRDLGFTEEEVKRLSIEIWNKLYRQYEKGKLQKGTNKTQDSV